MFAMIIFRNYNMGQILSFLASEESQDDVKLRQLAQRKVEQDKIIHEIRSIEKCVYCYVDQRIEKLLMP